MLREVLELRRIGWQIAAFSVLPPDRPDDQLSAEELAERKRTRYIKPARDEAFRALWEYLIQNPVRLFSAIGYAAGLGHRDPVSVVKRMSYLLGALLLGKWVREAGMKHLHTHYGSTVALLMHRLYPDLSFSMTVHGPDEVQDPVGFALREKLKNARLTVAISNYAKSQLMRFSEPEEWSGITACYLGTPAIAGVARQDPASDEAVRFLCVGRLAPVKGQHVLIEAAARLKATGRKFVVSITGGGPSAGSLKKAVSDAQLGDCVILEGRVPEARLVELYQTSHVFVLPSFAEGVPGVLMEAMITGLPCISTGVNGVPELIEAGIEGLLVAAADAEGLAEAMARMMDDPAARRRMGEAGRKKVLEKFNLETNVARLADIFQERLADRIAN